MSAWWDEAQEQLAVARELVAKHPSSAIFHALMALELTTKALRQAPARIEDLDLPIDELRDYTIGELGGLKPKKGHDPSAMLDAPWHPDTDLAVVVRVIRDIETELGLPHGKLYEACRYPDRWPDPGIAPSRRLSGRQAGPLVDAVARFLELVSNRLKA